VQQVFVGLVTMLASGQTYSPNTALDEVHRGNARHAEEYAAVGKAETPSRSSCTASATSSSTGAPGRSAGASCAWRRWWNTS